MSVVATQQIAVAPVGGAWSNMDIHFVSTLTPEDEDQYAPAVLNAVKAMLDLMPIAYTLRIATANGRVFQHTKSDVRVEPATDEMEEEAPTFVPGRVTFS